MLTYLDSGVDIKKADLLTDLIKNTVKSENIGLFAGLAEHPALPDYYIAATSDGIGTKIIPLIENNLYNCIANDLIAVNFNDLICSGAVPLFFLDYIAVNKLNVDFTAKIITSLQEQLKSYNTILIGGETSELKDLIKENYFDIAGFSAGFVKKENLLKKENVKKGDIIIGLISNGIHANGFSLVRKLYKDKLLSDSEFFSALKPSYIYAKEITELCNKKLIKACANISGGGIEANVKRIIPDNLCGEIDLKNIPSQHIFEKIKKFTGEQEAYRVFNMGAGFFIIARPENLEEIIKTCGKYNPFTLGVIKENDKNCNLCFR